MTTTQTHPDIRRAAFMLTTVLEKLDEVLADAEEVVTIRMDAGYIVVSGSANPVDRQVALTVDVSRMRP